MRRKFLHTICCILGCIKIYEACHVAEHNTRKRRQIISSSDSQIEITRDVRAYFSRCLRDKVGDVWDWNSVVDVSILDTQWYENSDQSNCSRAADRDTAPCWKARVNVYLRNSSNLIPPIEECIDMFTTDTSNGRRFYLFPATSSNSIAENGICSNVNPSQAQYFPNSATIRQYTSCNTQRTTTPRGRIPLHYPSVFQFFEAHTTCGVEFVHCSNQQTETLSLGDPTVSRWPYRMEALLKPDTSPLDSVVSCNKIVFPLADTAAAWTSWTDCGVTCGGGTSTRSRECPSTVTDCISEETRNCNTKPCPGCSLSTASRSRCGAIGIGKSACVALGCCFDRNSCYRAASTTNIFDGTFQPTVRPNQNVGGETGSPGSNFNLICDSRFSALPCTKNIVTNGGVCQMLACCWEPSLRVCYRARFQIIRVRDDCPAGSTNPPTCRDINECLSNPCKNGATCINGVNSYRCQCPPNTVGSNCQTNLVCGTPPIITGNGIHLPVKTLYSVGEDVMYSCFPPNSLIGATINTCVGGTWSQPAPSCAPTISFCGIPPTSLNVTYTPIQTTYPVTTTITYSCSNASPLSGSQTNRCLGAVWVNQSPTCTGCGVPPVTANVGYTPVKTSYTNMETISYICTNGVGIVGSEDNLCINNAWLKTAATCPTNHNCPQFCLAAPQPTSANGRPGIPSIPGGLNPIGQVITYSCLPGFTFTSGTSSTIVCGACGVWSGGAPACIAACGQPPATSVGLTYALVPSSGINPTIFPSGSVVAYTCSSPLLLFGFSSNLCNAGAWVNASPTCGSGCTAPPSISTGSYSPVQTNYMLMSVVTYTCNTGFTFELGATTMLMCGSAGWGSNTPTCFAVTCSLPPRPTNGDFFVPVASGRYAIGYTVTYACNANFAISGPTTNRCLSTGAWANAAATCTATGCGPPPVSSSAILSGPATPKTSFTIGETVMYTCATPFVLFGNSINTCLNTGLWQNLSPSCNNGCNAPASITNGVGTFTPVKVAYDLNEQVTYTCSTGYVFADGAESVVRCVSSLTWNFGAPVCNKQCSDPPRIASNGQTNNLLTPALYNTGHLVNYVCNAGYVIQGTTINICDSTGLWRWPAAPTCVAGCSAQPPTNSGVTFTVMKALYLAGDTVTYSCTAPTAVLSTFSATNSCQSNGNWQNPSPSCIVPM